MVAPFRPIQQRIVIVTLILLAVLLFSMFLAISLGSSSSGFSRGIVETLIAATHLFEGDDIQSVIIREIRLPRVLLAAVVGAVLSLAGLVFQCLLRNPLAEPYILGVSGGSAIGAILGILAGLSFFPGVTMAAFAGSMVVLGAVLLLAAGMFSSGGGDRNVLLLGGVMMNAFCAAVIMFLISITSSSQMHRVLFWLMGDLSLVSAGQLPVLLMVLPCFLVILLLARPMNLLLLGREEAAAMGVHVRNVILILLVTASFMVSLIVSQSGLIGFVGLVMPHICRQLLGSDHRLLVPSCILAGASYLVLCDLVARILSSSGEMPVGIITAMIGAPLFIFLLRRSKT